MSEQLLSYYNEQLAYLRKQGKTFANAHPKVAGNLNLGPGNIEDPLVGRLMESFAFLTGRVQYNLDQGNQQINENLLKIFYPHYDLPLPSFTIIKFELNNTLDQVQTVPKHTMLRTPVKDTFCNFRTTYETELLPLNLHNVKWRRHFDKKPLCENKNIKSCLSMSISSTHKEVTIKKLVTNKVRVYINLNPNIAYRLYEFLSNNIEELTVTYPGLEKNGIHITKDRIKFVGFSSNEDILTYPENSAQSYRVLTEFFAYPQKYLFFDIEGINQLDLPESLSTIELNMFLNVVDGECETMLEDDSLLLNCCPIINLFHQQGEVFYLNDSQSEYQIIASNNMNISDVEVYEIKSMFVTSAGSIEKNIKAMPYFGKNYTILNEENYLYWHSKRRQCWEIGAYHLAGSETFVLFSEFNKNNEDFNANFIVTPELLCTNRELTLEVPMDSDNPKFEFYPDNIEFINKIKCLCNISKPKYRKNNRETLINLLTHISVNQLNFDNKQSLEALKNTLSIYNYDDASDNYMIERGIIDVKTKLITKRNPDSLKQGFCQGIEYELYINEEYFTENNSYLFTEVLQYFLQQTCSINSFVQMVLKSKQRGLIKRWKPIIGSKKIL